MATTPFPRRESAVPTHAEPLADARRRADAVLAQMFGYFDPADLPFVARERTPDYDLVA